MAAHRTTSTTHWLNSIQSETDIIRPPQLPASPCCCGSESTEQSKISTVCCYGQMSSLYNLWKTVLFVHNTVCGCQTGFSTVSASKVLCVYWKWMLLVLGVKKVQIRYKKSKKEKAVILDTVCKNVKNVYCKHCSLSHIHPSCRSCLDAWCSSVLIALMCVQCSVSVSV